jgi:CRP-like cAMP-binding protein
MNTDQLTNDAVAKCRQVSLFYGLQNNEKALRHIAELFTIKQCSAGAKVISEGESGDVLFIIKSGVVTIVKKTKPGDPYTVAELSGENNMFFGEMALIDDDKRSATVICKTDCEFYLLTRDQFTRLGDMYPDVGLAMTRQLSEMLSSRLRKANSDIVMLFDALVGEVVESGGLS